MDSGATFRADMAFYVGTALWTLRTLLGIASRAFRLTRNIERSCFLDVRPEAKPAGEEEMRLGTSCCQRSTEEVLRRELDPKERSELPSFLGVCFGISCEEAIEEAMICEFITSLLS